MTRISLFVHDLHANPIGRAAPLAQALQRDYEVEVLGLLHGDGVYEPYRDLFEYRTIRCERDMTAVLPAIHRLAGMATGEVVYGFKPLVGSYGPALLASGFGRRRPLLLDVEDDEWVPMGATWPAFIRRDLIGGWRHSTAWKYTRALHPFVSCADGVTVSSQALLRRYGGTVVRHGPDETFFDPAIQPEPLQARVRFGLPPDVPLLLFAGTPQPHKGLDVLCDALTDPRAWAWHLVLAGPERLAPFEACVARLGARCHRTGHLPYQEMPALLAAVDAVPLPQLAVPFAESQLPAKALDAMAMARALVASRVGDLPDLLGEGSRGWLVPPGDAGALAGALAEMAANPMERARRGAAARDWFLAEASNRAIRARLVPLIEQARSAHRHRP